MSGNTDWVSIQGTQGTGGHPNPGIRILVKTLLPAWIAVPFLLILGGCVSIRALPQSATEVDFDVPLHGQVSTFRYEDRTFLKGAATDDVFSASKASLEVNGFTIRLAKVADGVAIGEHGVTAVDWNVVTGVYFVETQDGVKLALITETSHDFGFAGHATDADWNTLILNGIRTRIVSPDTKHQARDSEPPF